MRQEVKVTNELNNEGNPTGGRATALGIDIRFQDGPLGNPPDMLRHNGAFVEGIIEVAKQRLEFFQTASNGKFAHAKNAEAIEHLEAALVALDSRTAERKERGVEGTHQV